MSTTVEQVLARKGRQFYFVKPDESVLRASEIMIERNVGALLVFEDSMLIGILSERDCVRRVVARRLEASTTLVRDAMTPMPICVSPGESIDQCMALMTSSRFRHLPVKHGSLVVGVVTLGDAVHAVLSDKEDLIDHLESYISGSPISARPAG